MKNYLKVLLAVALNLSVSIQPYGVFCQNPSGSTQTLKPEGNQEACALFFHLYDRYANNVKTKGEFDQWMEKSLAGRPGSRERAKRVLEHFNKIPLKQREQMLGKWADLSKLTTVPDERYRTVFAETAKQKILIQSTSSVKESNDPDLPSGKMNAKDKQSEKDENPGPSTGGKQSLPEYLDIDLESFWNDGNVERLAFRDQLQRIGLCFRGIRCKEETDYDGGTAADEIYIITTVVDANNIITDKSPRGGDYGPASYYKNFDSGDKRTGPARYVWHSANGVKQIALITIVLEKDESDIQEVVDLVNDLATLGKTGCSLMQQGFWCGMGTRFMSVGLRAFFLADLFDNTDDVIEIVVWGGDNGDNFISEREMTNYLQQQDEEWRGIPYDFRTLHNQNEGADYRVFFRFQPE